MEFLIAFLLKMLDNALGTAKTIFISKEKHFYGSLFNALSFIFFSITLRQAMNDDGMGTIFIMSLAVFIGTYIPGHLFKRSQSDKLYIFDITADTLGEGKMFADDIRELGLAINTTTVYSQDMKKTLKCHIYCETKEESSLVVHMLKARKAFKYNVCVPIE